MTTPIRATKVEIVGLPAQMAEAVGIMLCDGITQFSGSTRSSSGMSGTDGALLINVNFDYHDAFHLLFVIRRMAVNWLRGQLDEFSSEPVKVIITAHDLSREITTLPNVKLSLGDDLAMESEEIAPPAAKLEKMALLTITATGISTAGAVALDSALGEWLSAMDDRGYVFSYDQTSRVVTLTFRSNWTFPGDSAYALARKWLQAIIDEEPRRISEALRAITLEMYDVNYHSGKTPVHTLVVREDEPYDVRWFSLMVPDTFDFEQEPLLLSTVAQHLAPGLNDPIVIKHKATRTYPAYPGYWFVVYDVEAGPKASLPAAKALADALLAQLMELHPVTDGENTGAERQLVRRVVAGGWDLEYPDAMNFYPNGIAEHRINVPAPEAEAEAAA